MKNRIPRREPGAPKGKKRKPLLPLPSPELARRLALMEQLNRLRDQARLRALELFEANEGRIAFEQCLAHVLKDYPELKPAVAPKPGNEPAKQPLAGRSKKKK
jgi:hypothetical protein